MRRENWPVTDYAVRPAGRPDECFYCHAKLGEQHGRGCVIRGRTTVIEVTVQLVHEYPEDWDDANIEFHLNDSSWCLSNILPEIGVLDERRGCICNFAVGRFVREASAEDEEKWGVRIVDAPRYGKE